jgi:hypothetical protein
MKIEGKRITVPRWVHADTCVVRVEVEAVIPAGDPSEPCYESHTVRWLKEVHGHAQAGDVGWLSKVGKVYVRQTEMKAASG